MGSNPENGADCVRIGQPKPYKNGLGGLRIVPGIGLDAKNTALRILCFSGQYCPISRGRAEIEADHRRFAGNTHPALATNDTVSDHKTSRNIIKPTIPDSNDWCVTLTIIGKPRVVTGNHSSSMVTMSHTYLEQPGLLPSIIPHRVD